MLSVHDIYNFYGLSMLKESDLKEEDKKMYTFFLEEIRGNYVKTLKRRIIEEAGYMNLDIKGTSLASILADVTKKLDEEIKKQADKMARMGAGFDMMTMMKASHAKKPGSGMESAASAFRSKEGKSRAMFGGEPWAKISEAFLAIEKADSPRAIVLAIDHLNALQHNCCHVIFDLTGTRGGGGGKHDDVKQVLDEKFKAKTPKEFAHKMTEEVRDFLKAQGVL